MRHVYYLAFMFLFVVYRGSRIKNLTMIREVKLRKEVFTVHRSCINNLSKCEIGIMHLSDKSEFPMRARDPTDGFKEGKSVSTSVFGQPDKLTHRIYTYAHTSVVILNGQYPERVLPQRIRPALISRPYFHSVSLLRIPTIAIGYLATPKLDICPVRSICLRDQYVRNTYNRIIVSARDRSDPIDVSSREIDTVNARCRVSNSRDLASCKRNKLETIVYLFLCNRRFESSIDALTRVHTLFF